MGDGGSGSLAIFHADTAHPIAKHTHAAVVSRGQGAFGAGGATIVDDEEGEEGDTKIWIQKSRLSQTCA